MAEEKEFGVITKEYTQSGAKARIEAFFLDNLGKVVTNKMLEEVAGISRWHQRLSELRCDDGYTILSHRDRKELQPGEYIMPDDSKREVSGKRVIISEEAWEKVLENAQYRCEWEEEGVLCGLKAGDIDPIGGGTVQLTPDHKTPHSMKADIDPDNPDEWQVLCARHQVVKKNYWDHSTGSINEYAIVQAAKESVKREIYDFLVTYFSCDD